MCSSDLRHVDVGRRQLFRLDRAAEGGLLAELGDVLGRLVGRVQWGPHRARGHGVHADALVQQVGRLVRAKCFYQHVAQVFIGSAKVGTRRAFLAELADEHRTVALYEAPHRVRRTVHDLLGECGPDRRIALARELTKLHEEVWRGTLAQAEEFLAEVEPRGEYVIVVEGAPPPAEADDAAITAALERELSTGVDRRTAIGRVTAATGASKRRVYDLALQLPR